MDEDFRPFKIKDFRGYSVVLYQKNYFGVPAGLGLVKLDAVDYTCLPEIIVRTSLRELEDALTERWALSLDDGNPHRVRSLNGYNIVVYRGLFYAISQALGEVRLEQTDPDGVAGVFNNVSLQGLEDEILDRWARSFIDGRPRLVCDSGLCNIVFFDGTYYGIPKALGDYHLDDPGAVDNPALIRDTTLAGVKRRVEMCHEPVGKKRGLLKLVNKMKKVA